MKLLPELQKRIEHINNITGHLRYPALARNEYLNHHMASTKCCEREASARILVTARVGSLLATMFVLHFTVFSHHIIWLQDAIGKKALMLRATELETISRLSRQPDQWQEAGAGTGAVQTDGRRYQR